MQDAAADDYLQFLRRKIRMANFAGFDLPLEAMHEKLFPHQRAIVQWAVKGGNRAIFASFGLGKSVMQCERMRMVSVAEGREFMGFPPDYRLPENDALAWVLLGNAVAPVQACDVIGALRRAA